MSEHSNQQQLTGSERLQRSATLARILTGASIALWLIPIVFLFVDVPRDELILMGILAGTLAMCTFITAQWLRSQRRHALWRTRVEDVSLRRHNDLTTQLADDSEALRQLLTFQLADLRLRVDQVAARLDRSSWDIYADAITDAQGGPEVFNGQDTRRLQQQHNNNVVHFPRTPGGH